MSKENRQVIDKELTWTKVFKWAGILYLISAVCFIIKALNQLENGFQNIWQFFAVLSLPLAYMIAFGLLTSVYLAFKKFRIKQEIGLFRFLALLYIMYVYFKLTSSAPL